MQNTLRGVALAALLALDGCSGHIIPLLFNGEDLDG